MNGSEASSSGTDLTSNPWQALGHCLQQAREREGLSLSSLAAKLHMGEEQLRALEDGNRAQLPETVFVIAQARRVAEALNIEINPLLDPLKQESARLKPAPKPLSTSGYAPRSAPSSNGGWRWLGSLALLAGLAAAGTWGWRAWSTASQRSERIKPALLRPNSPPAPSKPTKPAPAPAAMTEPKVTELKLSSEQPSWVAVRNGDGKSLYEGTLLGSKTFPLQGGLEVLAGRPDLVQVSLGNQPARPLGKIDQIRWVRLNAPAR